MSSTADTGRRGEDAACDWLMDNGFRILHRNWRSGRYELDIVAEKGDAIHFVEVKCRRRGSLTAPEDAFTRTKFDSLVKAARAYIAAYGIDLDAQFDLIAVEESFSSSTLRYIPNAMTPRW